MPRLLLALLACPALVACSDEPVGDTDLPDPDEPLVKVAPPSGALPEPAGVSPTDRPDCSTTQPPGLAPEAERSETGARSVLIEWARALENRQWARAWCQYADNGGASGQIFREFERDWSAKGRITIAVPTGKMEAAAGSSYYTAPARVSILGDDGKESILMGNIILRRVNDVPGESDEVLRWHIESARLTEVPQ
ncbi:hypothetical protein LY632_00065 [Erythrobacter sp. SDW2]|uniref:hypothetical protein n=1 Tax=Erythrobacter sp. SDW2 TaxID=2907154 RepID=UPI001F21B9C2|nr:hypothetical protein [Erythrobacter sp. SDW2]UIP06831.1 hypothetical protein LY632_00065 [Erythrobacter sp. SDW2]